MPSENEFSLSAIARKRGGTSRPVLAAPAATTALSPIIDVQSQPATPAAASAGFSLPFDPLRLIDAIYVRRWLLLAGGIATAIILGMVGWKRFETHHTAVAQLIKQAPSASLRQSEGGDPYQPHEIAIPTFIALMRSGDLIAKAASKTEGRLSEGMLQAGLVITPERNTDIIRVSVNSDKDGTTALAGLQAYVAEVLTLAREIQQRDAAEMNRFLQQHLATTDRDLIKINEELLAYARREQLVDADKQIDAWLGELGNYALKFESTRLDFETLDLKIHSIETELSKVSPAAAKLQSAREELAQLQLRYTDEHPNVLEAADRVKALEAGLETESRKLDAPPKPGESTVAESLYLELVKLRSEKEVLGEQLTKLTAVRTALNEKLSELPRKALELARIRSRKTALETSRELLAARQREAALAEEGAQGSFRLLAMARPQDVIIVAPSKKLALVTAGGFSLAVGMGAFVFALLALRDGRTLTRSDLNRATQLPVIGALPAAATNDGQKAADWAFRTWTNMHPTLLTPATGGAIVCGLLSDAPSSLPGLLGRAAGQRGASVIVISHQNTDTPSIDLTTAIANPSSILQRLGRDPEESVHLSMDEQWQWTTAQRQQFATALSFWQQSRNTVILVELCAPDKAETLLTAERLPNLVWVGSGEGSVVANLKAQISIYRAAGCRFAGALLDKAPSFRLPLLNKIAAACLALGGLSAQAQPAVSLGAGDIVNITIAGQPELARNGVTIAPDGTLTYLQAQAIPAAGLTLDELRSKLNAELRRYYKNAIVTVTPNLFQSRKVYVLGKVVNKGAINLDRPMTVLEVVAEAGGLETGLFQQNTVELADLGRSILVRGRERIKVDMEALFFRGDMSQNAPVEPGDYLYFPSANSNEIYVLGNVRMQGTQGLLAHTSVHSAIAQAGGFSAKAYTRRVLVVRGSFDQPEVFTVDMEDVLNARARGFRLEPKDIVFVADRPWARAEELLSFALNAFFQGAVSGWAGANVGPLIKETVLPSLR